MDGDRLDIKYSGIKKGNAALVFDGQNIVISNAYPTGTLAFRIMQRRKMGGDGSFILRNVAIDGDSESASLAGDVDNITAPLHTIDLLKFGSRRAVVSNIWIGAVKTIGASKGVIVGTVAVSNGFETLIAHAIVDARILAGVPPEAVVSNTPATAGFTSIKVAFIANSIVAGRDTMKGNRPVKPKIRTSTSVNSIFYHTSTNDAIVQDPL